MLQGGGLHIDPQEFDGLRADVPEGGPGPGNRNGNDLAGTQGGHGNEGRRRKRPLPLHKEIIRFVEASIIVVGAADTDCDGYFDAYAVDSNEAPPAEHSNHFETVRTMATKEDKSSYRYSDFYCFMSLADFAAYVDRDDEDGGDSFQISRKSR